MAFVLTPLCSARTSELDAGFPHRAVMVEDKRMWKNNNLSPFILAYKGYYVN